LTSVVFPAPRNPVTTVMGVRLSSSSAIFLMRILLRCLVAVNVGCAINQWTMDGQVEVRDERNECPPI
jgi:hypothetical protein